MLLERIHRHFELTMEEKIGEGRYREVYRSGNSAVKTLKDFRVKQGFSFPSGCPCQPIHWKNLGSKILTAMNGKTTGGCAIRSPSSRQGHFCAVHWAGKWQGRSVSISDLAIK